MTQATEVSFQWDKLVLYCVFVPMKDRNDVEIAAAQFAELIAELESLIIVPVWVAFSGVQRLIEKPTEVFLGWL